MSHYRKKCRRKSEAWMQLKDETGEAVARWRGRRKLTQRDLAYLCRCSQATISLIERGEMTTMSEDLALTLAQRLDVPWEELFVTRSSAGVRRAAGDTPATSRRPRKLQVPA